MWPSVTLKAASSLDGKIATASGESQWITGEAARRRGHELRHEHDAILVGINTVLQDNPQLTTRHLPDGRSPARVILDSLGRVTLEHACLADDGVACFVMVGSECSHQRLQVLQTGHVHVLQAPTPRPEPHWILSQLQEYQITSVLVEGGSQVHASFLKAQQVQRLVLFLGGKVIGGQGALSWCGELSSFRLEDAPQFHLESVECLENDLMIHATFQP